MYMVINVRQYGGLGLPYCLILFNNIIDKNRRQKMSVNIYIINKMELH